MTSSNTGAMGFVLQECLTVTPTNFDAGHSLFVVPLTAGLRAGKGFVLDKA